MGPSTNRRKVISGRVTKSGGARKAKGKTPAYVETQSDFEQDEDSDHSSFHLEGGDEAPSKSKSLARRNGNSAAFGGGVSNGNSRTRSVAHHAQREEEYEGLDDEDYADY